MKIVPFDEIYNFVVQNFSIWSHQIIDILSSEFKQKNYKMLKTDQTPTAVAHGDSRRYSTARAPAAVGHGGRSLPPFSTALNV
jgi:hypothetical protein